MSAYSSLLRQELEGALQKTGKFRLVTAERIAELKDEDQYQNHAN